MKKEDIEEMLKQKHSNGEDIDAEEVYYDNNRTAIRTAIEEGRIEIEILTREMLADFISDGIDFNVYEESVKKYCEENSIDYEEYKAGREKVIKENSERIAEEKKTKAERWNKVRQIEADLKREYGYEFIEDLRKEHPFTEDYHDYLIEVYGHEELFADEIEEAEFEEIKEDKSEVNNFMHAAADVADLPENVNIKNNWINRIREWIKDKVNTIKNTFQR